MQFNKHFTYLGSITNINLDDSRGAESRISKVSKIKIRPYYYVGREGALLETKVKLCNEMTLNMLLWGN